MGTFSCFLKKVIVTISFGFKVLEHLGRKCQEQINLYNIWKIHCISVSKHWLCTWAIWRSFEKYWYLGFTPRDSDSIGLEYSSISIFFLNIQVIGDLIFLRCHFSPNWSIDSLQPPSKPQEIFCRNWQVSFKIHIEMLRIEIVKY